MTEDFGVLFAFLKHFLEGLFRKEADIFREHREQAAHQKHCDVLGAIVLLFERERDLREALCNIARYLRGSLRRVQRYWIEPDFAQAFAGFLIAQVFKINAEGLAVWELSVVLSLSREVGIDLDAMSDVADEDERRPAV